MEINLKSELLSGKTEFTQDMIIIDGPGEFFSDSYFRNISLITFNKCIFRGSYLELENIKNSRLNLKFLYCTFECTLVIKNCSLETLEFIDVKGIKNLDIIGNTFDNFYFRNNHINTNPLSGNIDITQNIVLQLLKFDNLRYEGEEFRFSLRNNFENERHKKLRSSFQNSVFTSLIIDNSSFGYETNFQKIKISDSLKFKDCKFYKVDFKYATFGSSVDFDDCKVYSKFEFTNCKSVPSCEMKFHRCLFKSFSHFNESTFGRLSITFTTFERKTSFDRLVVSTLKLHQVTFLQNTYFDELKILEIERFAKIDKEDAIERKRTLRLIKQELQKSDNKIDYNRFRVYEFTAYKQELTQHLKEMRAQTGLINRVFTKDRNYSKIKRDLLILNLSELISDYGTDWKRALKWTILLGLLLYIPFFISENWNNSVDWDNWQIFPIGFLRFFILTDFYNPLADGKTYIENDGCNHLISWLLFILGKIVIAFGIYEMIQAFRKFKA